MLRSCPYLYVCFLGFLLMEHVVNLTLESSDDDDCYLMKSPQSGGQVEDEVKDNRIIRGAKRFK